MSQISIFDRKNKDFRSQEQKLNLKIDSEILSQACQ